MMGAIVKLLSSEPSQEIIGLLSCTMISLGIATFLALSLGKLSAGYGRCETS